MDVSGNTVKHLIMIQAVISRMAKNSFLLKGWCVTLESAIFALAAKGGSSGMVWIALLPFFMFWGLDGYFLRQERLFRRLYDAVRVKEEGTDFSMDTRPFGKKVAPWYQVCFSRTLAGFYLPIALVILVIGSWC